MIIHIVGPSGSGKTTLGKKLSKLKDTIIVDTDDIDDPNSMKIVNKYSFKSKTDINKLIKELSIKNKNDLNNILVKNKNKNIIFVGFLHAGMGFLEKKLNKKYSIKIDEDTLWRQYNKRTATYIHKNFNEIIKLLNGKNIPKKLDFIFSKKFGIRDGFNCDSINDMKEYIKINKKRAKDNKYSYLTSEEIYDNIIKLLS